MRNDLCVGWVVMTILVAVAATVDASAAESKRSNVIKISKRPTAATARA